MEFEALKAADQEYIANTYGRFDVDVVSGKGAVCYDANGKAYVDFTSGIGVNCLGFCHPSWTEAVKKQLDCFAHISNLFYTQPCVTLAEKLCRKTGFKKVFFGNSGAEANEGAIKTARKYGMDHYGKERYEIVTLVNSFHGRTITTLCATGQDVFHQKFQPLTEGFSYVKAGDFADLQNKITSKTCAVMMEMIQGEGGVIPLEQSYVDAVASLCKEKDILLIVDEVQTGVGRTGKFFAFENYGIHPDIVTMAKGLGGGLPIGAVLFGEKTKDVLGSGDHGSTFGGNPVSCAGGNYIVDHMTPEFLAEVVQKGAYIREKVQSFPQVEGITGAGLMLGISLKKGVSGAITKQCAENGLLILTAKEKLRMLPPLTITKEEIDNGLEILEKILSSL